MELLRLTGLVVVLMTQPTQGENTLSILVFRLWDYDDENMRIRIRQCVSSLNTHTPITHRRTVNIQVHSPPPPRRGEEGGKSQR